MAEECIINGEVVPRSEMYSTPERCLIWVKHDSSHLKNIPERMKTYEVCLEAVKAATRQQNVIVYVPKPLQTTEIYSEYAKRCVYALHYIPEELQTYEMCLDNVKLNGDSLGVVPEKYKTPELCLEAVKNTTQSYVLYHVPNKYKTFELCLQAIKKSDVQTWAEIIGLCVPQKYQTAEFYTLLMEDLE